MRFTDRYPIVVTSHKNSCRDFWVRYFDLQVGFDSQWFCWLTAADGSLSIAFMTPDHPSAPPGPEVFSGHGLCFEIQVLDAAGALEAFLTRGGTAELPLTLEPFGQRRFGFRDPAGLWVDVVEQVEPAAGWWEPYMVVDSSGSGRLGATRDASSGLA